MRLTEKGKDSLMTITPFHLVAFPSFYSQGQVQEEMQGLFLNLYQPCLDDSTPSTT